MVRSPLLERVRRRFWWQLGDPVVKAVRDPLRRYLNAQRSYQPVFICGAMGSGTSLIALQLAQRFTCAGVVYESANEIAESSELHIPGPERFPTVAAYRDALRPQPQWDPQRARADLLALYRATATGGSDVIIDKGPNANLARAGFLARCFGEAHFVLIFRDPVTNIEGFRRKWPTFGSDSLQASIQFYAEMHERFLEAGQAFADRVTAVDYSDLVRANDALLDALGARLLLAPAGAHRRLRSRGNLEGRGIRNVKNSRIGVVDDADARAYDRMDAAAIEEVQSALAPLYTRMSELALKPEGVSARSPDE
jgi:hypothetical protein